MNQSMKHIITQEDIDLNPSLIELGINIGDEVELPSPTEGTPEEVANAVAQWAEQNKPAPLSESENVEVANDDVPADGEDEA